MPDASNMSALVVAGLLGAEAAFLPACASWSPCPAERVVAQRHAALAEESESTLAEAPAPSHEPLLSKMIFPARWVEGNLLVSTDVPEIRVAVEEGFEYVGSTRYTLIDEVGAETFLFADSDGDGNIRRQLAFIFEGALPHSSFTYNYSSDELERIGANVYNSDTFFFWGMDEAIAEDPDRDTAIIHRHLRDMGFKQPDDGLIQRFVRVVTDDRHNEFIIAYSEDLADLGYSRDELAEGGVANHLVPSISTSLRERALSTFTIIQEPGDSPITIPPTPDLVPMDDAPLSIENEPTLDLDDEPEPPIDLEELEEDDGPGR